MALSTSGSAGTSSDSAADSLSSSDADIAQTFRDLARGEQTALALESHLTNLERKLDDFLASFEESERQMGEAVGGNKASGTSDAKKS